MVCLFFVVIEGEPAKIVLVGVFTVASEGGWGSGSYKVMTPNVRCVDPALKGRSSGILSVGIKDMVVKFALQESLRIRRRLKSEWAGGHVETVKLASNYASS